jgi:hypothetical protein
MPNAKKPKENDHLGLLRLARALDAVEPPEAAVPKAELPQKTAEEKPPEPVARDDRPTSAHSA